MGHVDVMKVLIEGGADVNTQNKYQRTALHYGSAGGHHDNVRVLLERGADPNTRDKEDFS
jgi:ankyrin repeat protein